MVAERWGERELMILRAIVEAEEAREDLDAAGATATDISKDEYMLCVRRLWDDGYIEARFNRGDNRLMSVHVLGAKPKALREVGLWPQPLGGLEAKRRARLAFMTKLYEKTDGNGTAFVDQMDIGSELGWQSEETYAVVNYLNDEGLLTFVATEGLIAITHEGVVEIEQAIERPKKPTPHFPPMITINVYGNIEDSQLQVGTSDSHQKKDSDG